MEIQIPHVLSDVDIIFITALNDILSITKLQTYSIHYIDLENCGYGCILECQILFS